jgi:hypothetical protein
MGEGRTLIIIWIFFKYKLLYSSTSYNEDILQHWDAVEIYAPPVRRRSGPGFRTGNGKPVN